MSQITIPLIQAFELETSNIGSLVCNDYLGNPVPGFTHKLYKADGTEVTTENQEANCVKTVVDYEPQFDRLDFGGAFLTDATISQDVFLHVIAAPTIPAQFGGSIEMVRGLNLKFIKSGSQLSLDMMNSKDVVKYDPATKSGMIRLEFNHQAGAYYKMTFVGFYMRVL